MNTSKGEFVIVLQYRMSTRHEWVDLREFPTDRQGREAAEAALLQHQTEAIGFPHRLIKR
jgi:hypothetical protein